MLLLGFILSYYSFPPCIFSLGKLTSVVSSAIYMLKKNVRRSVMSDSLRSHGLEFPGSSVHGILQASTLKWVAISSSRGSS